MGSVSEYRGKIVLVNLWATWCPPCREEIPSLERLWRLERGRGVVVLGIDQGESSRVVEAFARHSGVSYPLLIDTDQRYGRAYGSLGLPTTILVDRNGRVFQSVDGILSFAQMQAAVNTVLAAAR
jgi:thiol-disulfide isomerase/thioredoxin